MTTRGFLRHLALCATLLVACSEGPTGPDVGRLNISILGLPAGAAAAVDVEGPDGFVESITADEVFDAVPSGQYIVTVAPTWFEEDIYASAVSVDTIRVSRGREVEVELSYALASGSIAFAALGLPDEIAAEANLLGPGGLSRTITMPSTARGLIAGTWQVSFPRHFAGNGHGYDAPSQTFAVTASRVAVVRPVAYTLSTGAIEATFNGLPDGVAPRGVVLSTLGIVTTLEANGTRTGFTPGAYTLSPLNVFDEDVRYSASSVMQTVDVGLVPRSFVINYLPRTGRLTVAATGLPGGAVGRARVTSASGLDTSLAAGDTLKGLPAGNYSVAGERVVNGGQLYLSESLTPVSVVGAQTSLATLSYSSGAALDLSLDAAYAVQAVQRLDGSVPLIANRSALVRVFATATFPNSLSVPVRVRIVNGGSTVFEQLVPAASPGVPFDVDESTFEGSWRVDVPGSAIQPGAELHVMLDPAESVSEDGDRSNNSLTRALDVHTLSTFRGRFVPIRFSTSGNAGNVNAGNAASFMQLTRDMMPVADVDIDLRNEYVTTQPPLTTSSGAVWEAVLGELNTLRVLEATKRYYMGIIPVGYSSGIAGIGYIGAPASLTWDRLPSGGEVLAHELGHNFARRHSPCGGAAGVDALYPHAEANIGAWGWDARLNRLRPPTEKDIMSYCDDPWVSDYTWDRVLNFREASEPLSTFVAGPQSVLLVRGRITPDGVQLDPVFRLEAEPATPTAGPHRLELRDAGGSVIYSTTFRASPVPHAEREGTEHFVFAIPTAALGGREVGALAVRSGANSAELRESTRASVRVAPGVSAVRDAAGDLRVTDSDPATQGMIIREASTGRIISIVRGRDITLPGGLGELDVLSSDGLRSRMLRIKPSSR